MIFYLYCCLTCAHPQKHDIKNWPQNTSKGVVTQFQRSCRLYIKDRINKELCYSKATIYDQSTGQTIELADPEHPELADFKNPPFVLKQYLDPYAKYDDPQNRRNKNDPMHIDEDMLDCGHQITMTMYLIALL